MHRRVNSIPGRRKELDLPETVAEGDPDSPSLGGSGGVTHLCATARIATG